MSVFQSIAVNDIYTLRMICSHSRNGPNNLEEVDEYGNTPLLKACYLGRYECVDTLFQYGVNVKAINYFGQNALTLATYAGSLAIVRELLRYRSYEDFNKAALVPAICVAALRRNQQLVAFYKQLESSHGQDMFSVHGLNYEDIEEMVEPKPLKRIII